VALRLALAEPGLAARLFLVSPGGYRDQDWERVAGAVTVESHGDARRVLAALFARPPWALRLLPGALAALYRAAPVRHLLAGALGPEDAFGDEELARVAAPTALLWGERDGIFPLSTGEAMARALPCATLYQIPGAAHLPHWERRREALAALADFRRRHPAPLEAPLEGNRGGGHTG
jgi:pimeloyl-ACP methyl ester carboxylesterase